MLFSNQSPATRADFLNFFGRASVVIRAKIEKTPFVAGLLLGLERK